jgi:hypothetical protein
LEGKGEFAVPTLEGKREPGVYTPEAIRGAHGKEFDAISVTVGIKQRRGAAVADLIKVFESTPQTFDPGVRSNLAEVRKMSPVVDGGDQGGAGEAPTHPKSIGGSAIVPMRSGHKLMFVEEQVEEDSNWDGEAMEGSNVGPEAHIGGEVDSEDEARVEFEDEEEGVQDEPGTGGMADVCTVLLTEGDEHQRDLAALHGCLENLRYDDVLAVKGQLLYHHF